MELKKIQKYNRLIGFADTIANEHQWASYYWQIQLITSKLSKKLKIVEIGIGHGVLKRELEALKYRITTVDLDERKKPDIVCDIMDINWAELAPDAVALFEVLEHISLEENKTVLTQMAKSKINKLFISIPINNKNIISFGGTLLSSRWLGFKLHCRTKLCKTHKWEIKAGCTQKKYRQLLTETGWNICEVLPVSNRWLFYVVTNANLK